MLQRLASFGTVLLSLTTPALGAEGLFRDLTFRSIGPVGNRVPAVVGVPGDPLTYYAGAASGGIWKTIDGGVRWRPIADHLDVSSIGSLAVAASDPNIVWAGTGETFIRSNVSVGNGIYRSTDAGETWQRLGLEQSGRIGRIVIHPSKPEIVYAAALGHSYGPQSTRGLYRTRDGGGSWQQILFVDQNTGAIDLVMDPANPRILYAAMWEFSMRTSGRVSGGPGSGIWRSKDGGDTWEQLGPQTDAQHAVRPNGTPKGPWGKIGLTISAIDPKRLYALIETNSNDEFGPVEGWDGEGYQGVLWRSDDRGETWHLVSRDNTLHQRPLYYTRMMAAPDNAEELTFMAVQQSISIDGGRTISTQNSGWDHHDIWIDPSNPARRITGHDGGVSITNDRGKNWFRPQLPIAQLYHVNVDDQIPYFVYGNRQDGPSMKGPSHDLSSGTIPLSAWSSVGGCEVGFAVPTPGNADIVWTGCYDGILERFDAATGHSRDVSVKPLAIESWPGVDLEYRFQWSFPIEISPHDPDLVYVGSQIVHRSSDGGQSWADISPDLSTGDEELMLRTGGLTLDDAGPTIAAVIFAIAESHLERGQIWAGTNDGRLHLTRDGGETWTDLSDGLAGAPPLGTISNIEPSRHDPAHAYVTVDGHQENDPGTYVYKTEDYGRSWRSLRSDLVQGPLSYAHCIKEDPQVPGLLYLGLHNRLMVSLDDGATWQRLGEGTLPPAPVSWIEVQEHFGDLVLSTYGRGFYILDDLSGLRDAASVAQRKAPPNTTLISPRSTYRFRPTQSAMTVPDIPATGINPEYGAHLWYRVGDDQELENLKLEIRSADDRIIRTLDELEADAGLHRVVWDLRGESTTRARRTLPPEGNPFSSPGLDARSFSILQPPGQYTVRLVNGEGEDQTTLSSESLTVLIDPRSDASSDDIAEQLSVLRPLFETIEQASTLHNHLESLRSQVSDWSAQVDGANLDAELESSLNALQDDLESMQNELVDLRLTTARQDSLRWKRMLLAQLQYLAYRIHKTDHAPTDAQRELALELIEQFEALQNRFTEALSQLPSLNQALATADLDAIGYGLEDSSPR